MPKAGRKVSGGNRSAGAEVMDAICQADLVYFMIPNYCGFSPASYYTFNEGIVGYFNKSGVVMEKYRTVAKRFIIISKTEGTQFESAIRSQVMCAPEMVYLKTGKYKKQNTAGDLIESEDAKADLLAFLVGTDPVNCIIA